MNNHEKIALKAVKISLLALLVLLILGSGCGWMLLNQTAAVAKMSHEQKELERRVESLEAQLTAILSKE
ncbi:DUF5408 family protein [Wolinella succinogenes]|jgi:hypothetical protein|uniref:Lipoprotein n=1 Tax=Wolinella succinogenes (strain ATCC 29543 / DSM 1740 / CCUG 13145 / JCM 31913 / LMG 7466 / NCTC 11488 / FDC 602W) TaxID=273121 RepID=Q7MRJ0_WOLSU|nr:DUF5408 family protein [Wolinella succinogenes]NLU33902.1 DUF5408 family protein [Wolinella succinogenes]CAE10390.1 hypothetical protein WS1314 [Wolinella succinogenes]VEG80470.1 Uncharacterised protein [Wolinella succinogenes]HCZ19812.1 hypothetical protein [Helicobacter sp.]